jgi:hypothetical protein
MNSSQTLRVLKKQVWEARVLIEISRFPPPAASPERMRQEREVVAVVRSLGPDMHPENVTVLVAVNRFIVGLSRDELQVVAKTGKPGVVQGKKSAEDVAHFDQNSCWPGDTPRVLSAEEVERAIRTDLQLMAGVEKEQKEGRAGGS